MTRPPARSTPGAGWALALLALATLAPAGLAGCRRDARPVSGSAAGAPAGAGDSSASLPADTMTPPAPATADTPPGRRDSTPAPATRRDTTRRDTTPPDTVRPAPHKPNVDPGRYPRPPVTIPRQSRP
ncbi:MAG TPA: hypothetical protein VFS40_04750 [Gemmatimonadales bacterium]|nr:hypothetical protein [Gemmatimonadales bacterium]